jgi:hypothetical protein
VGFQQGLAQVDHEAEIRRILETKPRVIVIDENAAWTEGQEVDPRLKALIKARIASSYSLRDSFNTVDDQVRARIFVLGD